MDLAAIVLIYKNFQSSCDRFGSSAVRCFFGAAVCKTVVFGYKLIWRVCTLLTRPEAMLKPKHVTQARLPKRSWHSRTDTAEGESYAKFPSDLSQTRICTSPVGTVLFESKLIDGTPVRAKDFSQSCVEGPRILPSI